MPEENKKIAIDIVLLLPDGLSKVVCDLSSKIIPVEGLKPYVLDNINYFPHISLLMGTAFEGDIEMIKEKIKPIIKKYFPLEITFSHIEISKNNFPYLAIEKSEKLTNLQKEISEIVELDYDATKEMCADPDISDFGISFINNFMNNFNEGKSKLHVTLGLGDAGLLSIDFPLQTVLDTMAIGQIGYGCSCRKILSQVSPK
jgi:hypothetical protein